MKRYIIWARSCSGQWLAFVDSETQGRRMVPNAESMARQFRNLPQAKAKALLLAQEWHGLTDWTVAKI